MHVTSCILLSALLLPAAAFAQAASGETVPKELMAVLLRGAGMGSNDFDLRVGPPPKEFPLAVLPPGSKIGVSAISERMTTVVGTVAGAVDRLKEQQRLTGDGWQSSMPRSRGFVTTGAEFPLSVCRGSEFVSLTYPSRPGGGSYVRATLTRDPRLSCMPRSDMGMGFADVPVPDLTPPDDVRSYPSGSGSNSDSMHATARLEKKQSVESLAKHYAEQMKAAGWRLDGITTAGDDLSVARVSLTTKAGDAITGMIAVTALAGTGEANAMLYIVRNKSDRRFPGVSTFGIIR